MFKSLFKMSSVKAFGVVGSGQMGTGIAIVANRVAKLPVVIYDSNEQALEKSDKFIKDWLCKEVSKKRITEAEVGEFNQRLILSKDIK
jgi:3-hydroxybutyryl-CoA dehydrogenase